MRRHAALIALIAFAVLATGLGRYVHATLEHGPADVVCCDGQQGPTLPTPETPDHDDSDDGHCTVCHLLTGAAKQVVTPGAATAAIEPADTGEAVAPETQRPHSRERTGATARGPPSRITR